VSEPFDSALDLAAAIRTRELSSVEALDACLDAVDRVNPKLNAVIWRDDEDARRRAAAADEALARDADAAGPFCGVPLPIKDLDPVAGWPVTYGSNGAPEGVSEQSQVYVERFEQAGFVLACRTNSPELGLITATENSRYGATRNPWDTERTPGGSSGGAAAAVAGGMFPIAHGNDGGGSIRIPAACCGLVGHKPSRGRTPRLSQGWQGAIVEGVLSRTVADTAAVLDVISALDPLAWYNAPPPARPFAEEVGADPGRLRIALVTESPSGLPVDPECAAAASEIADALAGLGHELVDPPELVVDLEQLIPHFYTVIAGSDGADYAHLDWDRVDPHVRAIYDLGTGSSAIAFAGASRYFELLTREIAAAWTSDFDVLVTPTLGILPPPAGSLLESARANPGEPSMELMRMTTFTAVFNMTGQPAISVPACATGDGFPVGVQVVGAPFDDATVLRLAAQLETAMPWSARRPELAAAS
jgi:amidase